MRVVLLHCRTVTSVNFSGRTSVPDSPDTKTDRLASSKKRLSKSGSNSSNLVTLNVYASRVCLKFSSVIPSQPSAVSVSDMWLPSTLAHRKGKGYAFTSASRTSGCAAAASGAPYSSCRELIDVSHYRCDCEDRLELEPKTVLCLKSTWYYCIELFIALLHFAMLSSQRTGFERPNKGYQQNSPTK